MKELLELVGLGLAMVFLIGGVVLAVFSPIVLIVWLIVSSL